MKDKVYFSGLTIIIVSFIACVVSFYLLIFGIPTTIFGNPKTALPTMTKTLVTLIFLTILTIGNAQTTKEFADSLRKTYNIPELNYAVISSDKIIEIQALGTKKINSNSKAELTDKFRIGSNTKTVTSYIATLLVKEGKIKWNTKFFDLYPELKLKSNPAYHDLTLQDLITFRAKIISWSYGNENPTKNEIKGNE